MKEQAQSRYQYLATDRTQFLETGREAAALTLPYLLTTEGMASGNRLPTPWQSQGARGVNVLASKLMLSLFPINTSFFKLQINDAELAALPGVDATMRSEIDLSLSKMEKMIMQQIAESSDRVVLFNAMRHLIVTGNALIFAGKKALRVYPLDRYVIDRDGDGNVVEILTREVINRSLLPKEFQKPLMSGTDVNSPGDDGPKFGVTANSTGGNVSNPEEVDVYTWATLKDGHWKWHQEVEDKILPGSQSSSPKKSTPWIPLRFNVSSAGESYGRGRVEEFMGDLRSLEGLMQSLVEGSAAAAKIVFLVSPAATTKPQSLARASNGAIIQGRPEDVGVVQSNGKAADFKTVQEMIVSLTQRLSDAFLILQVRDSERTTAMEVRATQQELSEQLGGIYGNLMVDLQLPYLYRKLNILTRHKGIPPLPKGLVMPTVVAGLNGVGRGQDRQALMEFITLLAQTLGPESIPQYVKPSELIKRLGASSGIDMLGLIKTEEEIQQEQQEAQKQQEMQQLTAQAGQLAKSPIGEKIFGNQQQQQQQAQAPEGT